MADVRQVVDVDRLRDEVREKYREVAQDPSAEYHFHTGRAHAHRLGYPAWPLDELPAYACEAFAGVGNPFHWEVRSRANGCWISAPVPGWTACWPRDGLAPRAS